MRLGACRRCVPQCCGRLDWSEPFGAIRADSVDAPAGEFGCTARVVDGPRVDFEPFGMYQSDDMFVEFAMVRMNVRRADGMGDLSPPRMPVRQGETVPLEEAGQTKAGRHEVECREEGVIEGGNDDARFLVTRFDALKLPGDRMNVGVDPFRAGVGELELQIHVQAGVVHEIHQVSEGGNASVREVRGEPATYVDLCQIFNLRFAHTGRDFTSAFEGRIVDEHNGPVNQHVGIRLNPLETGVRGRPERGHSVFGGLLGVPAMGDQETHESIVAEKSGVPVNADPLLGWRCVGGS